MPPESSAGEVRDVGGQADLGEDFDGFFAGIFAGDFLLRQQPEGDVFPDRDAVEQGAVLEQHADLPAQFARARARRAQHVLTVDFNAAGICRNQAEDAFDQHRFAGARASYDHHGGLRHDVEIDAVQHFFGPERLLQAADFDFRRHFTNSNWVRM
jgi:hypothetical protein